MANVQRFRKSSPCPICGGYDEAPRGKGVRCSGFLSGDGQYAHCTRDEYAGGLRPSKATPPTYAHRLIGGDCKCGIRHDPAPPPASSNWHQERIIVATYDYTDEAGKLLYQVVRYRLPNGEKTFSQRHRDAKGRWIDNITGVRRVIYNLPAVLEAIAAEKIIVTAEGEEDVKALQAHGYTATCNHGGAEKWTDAHSQFLIGAVDVVLFGDNDSAGRKHIQKQILSLKTVRIVPRLAKMEGLPEKGDIRDWLKTHSQEDLDRLISDAKPATDATEALESQTAAEEDDSNPWVHIKSAPAFLSEPETIFEGLAKDLLAPGAITIISAPKGLGKTQVAHNLAVALATGGIFRGEVVKPVRVLLLDRDNPDSVIKKRLRNWGAATADRLHVLTRRHAPDLKDREAWGQFPLDDYDVLIMDAVGSFTEGITEKEGRLTTEVLATLLDLARRGIAILLLNNVTKDGANFKGREEWADRVDIMFEVRDATGFTPSGKGDWWIELPSAAECDWAERAQRRKGTVTFRLAFIPSKFRLGPEPEPFVLELHLPPEGLWTLKDVTSALIQAGEDAKREAIEAKKAQREAAAQALAEQLDNGPLNKTDAEAFLREQGIGRNEARQMFTQYDRTLWFISAGEGKGAPQILFKVGGGVNNHNGEPLVDKELPYEHLRQLGTQGGANGASSEPLTESPAGHPIFSAGESRPQKTHTKEAWVYGRKGGK